MAVWAPYRYPEAAVRVAGEPASDLFSMDNSSE